MRDAVKGTVACVTAMFVWATSFSITKIGLGETEPLTLAFIRSFLASMFLMIILLVKERNLQLVRSTRADWKHFVLLGATGIALFNALQNAGVQYTSSALAGVLVNTNPLFILILSRMLLNERITRNQVIGMVTGFAGLVVVLFAGHSVAEFVGSGAFRGSLLLIGCALSWAAYSILNKRLSGEYSPLHLTTIAYVFGSFALLPFVLALEKVPRPFLYSTRSWMIILYLGIVASGIAYLLWNYALSRMDASKASAFLFLMPVITTLIGWLCMGEVITAEFIIGTVLVLAGIYLAGF
jgi:drug/metabolite transporter (DMT)-like permease